MHYIRTLLLGDEIARFVFGQAGLHLGQNFGVLVVGVELLQLRPQASALGRGGGEGDAANRKAFYILSLVKRRRRTHAQQAAGHPRRRRMKMEPGRADPSLS